MAIPLNKTSNIVALLSRKFYRGSLDFNIEHEDVMKMTWNKQEEFLNITIRSSLLKRFPVKSDFARLFFKKLISFLEKSQEVHDDIYQSLCEAMNTPNETFCYRHYVIGADFSNVVTLKETNNMVVNGTTGLRTWEAAIMLTDWALCNSVTFKEKNVLELGSGVGFTGITIAKFCQPSCFFLSDCHEDVLKTAEENIASNFSSLQRQQLADKIIFQDSKQTIGVINLDWNEIFDISNNFIPDIIVGSDIIYDPTIVEPLSNVINTFCNKNKNVEIYIAGVIRNENTLNLFLQNLDYKNLQYQTITHSENTFLEWDLKVKQYLLKINRKSYCVLLYFRYPTCYFFTLYSGSSPTDMTVGS